MLEIRNIRLKFKSFSLKNLSMKIEKGEYHLLLGPSGSGKTLLLNIIAGFVKQESGELFYNNRDISKLNPYERKISYLFQDLALFPHLSVFENVAFPLKVQKKSKNEINEKVKKYLEFTEVYHLKDRSIQKLSGGEKQRVALARSLITESKMLMLDEPFSAIDSQLKLSLKKLLKKISDTGITIIHVTHNLEEAYNLADKVSIIEDGQLIKTGALKHIFEKPVNKFMASFTGYRNFFYCKGFEKTENSNFILISCNKNDDKTVKFEIPEIQENSTAIIVESSSIILSLNKIESSARNNFQGDVVSVFRNQSGFEVEVDIGIPLWVSVTSNSYKELKIEIGQKLWISFKASAIKFI